MAAEETTKLLYTSMRIAKIRPYVWMPSGALFSRAHRYKIISILTLLIDPRVACREAVNVKPRIRKVPTNI